MGRSWLYLKYYIVTEKQTEATKLTMSGLMKHDFSLGKGTIPNPPAPTLLPPKAVSPLIKAGRYGALLAGILYGQYRFKQLVVIEQQIQAKDDLVRAEIKCRGEEKVAAASKIEMANLAVEFGVTPK